VQLINAASDGNATPPAEQATGLIAQGCRVLLVTTGDPAQTKAIAKIAANGPDGAVPIIVLDPSVQGEHGACVIGCSAKTLGQAAAAVVNQLLPEGGSMIACFGKDSEGRVQGFCEAMGFASDRLLGR
jgi:ABC-type sugar transport system substrate-binding protein